MNNFNTYTAAAGKKDAACCGPGQLLMLVSSSLHLTVAILTFASICGIICLYLRRIESAFLIARR
jgi:hypothetical protein